MSGCVSCTQAYLFLGAGCLGGLLVQPQVDRLPLLVLSFGSVVAPPVGAVE